MTAPRENPTERLARLHRWCTTGRLAAAELELGDWCRQGDPAPGARRLLAAIKARRGALHEARDVLRQAAADPAGLRAEGLKLLVALYTALDEPEVAATHTRALHEQFGEQRHVTRWLAVSDAPGVSELSPHSSSRATRLAESLQDRPELIPTLVFAQKQRPSTAGIALLRSALLRLVPAQHEDAWTSLMLCRGLAELAQLAGDDDEARRWAHRGLEHDPYSAELALILSWVPDEDAVGEPADRVLARVHGRFPRYRDVEAALHRRRDGGAGTAETRRAA